MMIKKEKKKRGEHQGEKQKAKMVKKRRRERKKGGADREWREKTKFMQIESEIFCTGRMRNVAAAFIIRIYASSPMFHARAS